MKLNSKDQNIWICPLCGDAFCTLINKEHCCTSCGSGNGNKNILSVLCYHYFTKKYKGYCMCEKCGYLPEYETEESKKLRKKRIAEINSLLWPNYFKGVDIK